MSDKKNEKKDKSSQIVVKPRQERPILIASHL